MSKSLIHNDMAYRPWALNLISDTPFFFSQDNYNIQVKSDIWQ